MLRQDITHSVRRLVSDVCEALGESMHEVIDLSEEDEPVVPVDDDVVECATPEPPPTQLLLLNDEDEQNKPSTVDRSLTHQTNGLPRAVQENQSVDDDDECMIIGRFFLSSLYDFIENSFARSEESWSCV